jgi:hypothetical protein
METWPIVDENASLSLSENPVRLIWPDILSGSGHAVDKSRLFLAARDFDKHKHVPSARQAGHFIVQPSPKKVRRTPASGAAVTRRLKLNSGKASRAQAPRLQVQGIPIRTVCGHA